MSSDSHDEAEAFFKKYQKEAKAERKQKTALDRSKYKKTDQPLHQKKHLKEEEGVANGIVVRIVSRGFIVAYAGKEYLSSIKGSLKEQEHEDKNLVTIGDYVQFNPVENDLSTITSVIPRKSVLVRQDKLIRGKRQILAANVDQVIICSSLIDPPLKPSLIDRYIIAAKKGQITPLIAVNKCDRLEESEEENALFLELQRAYALAGIPLIAVSAKSRLGLKDLELFMEGKISVFSGQSGVGKSSLINAILGTHLIVGETTKMRKGAHTTTHPLLLPLKSGYCLDTPGVKSFAIWALNEEPIDTYFDEIARYKEKCRFRDCTHSHEEGCEVIKMVEEGSISPLRYASYISLLGDQDTQRR
jgi:ribosome biogenesis GTPase